MRRSPLLFAQRTLAGLIALGLLSLTVSAAAQTEAPPAAAAAPAQDLKGSTPQEDGRERAGDAASPAPVAPAAPQPVVVPDDASRQEELARLYALLERQRAGNRRWQVPTIGLVLGTVTLLTGAMLYVGSMSDLGDLPCDEDDQPCGYNDRKLAAGVSLMLIGPTLMLISAPMLMVRSARASRMRATETAIRRLGGNLSVAPQLGLHGELGFRLHTRF